MLIIHLIFSGGLSNSFAWRFVLTLCYNLLNHGLVGNDFGNSKRVGPFFDDVIGCSSVARNFVSHDVDVPS